MIVQNRSDSAKKRTGWMKKEVIAVVFIVFGLLTALDSRSAVAADIDLGGESKLVVHGYMSQAYANSAGGTMIGIPQDGTTDYRNAALQFRYEYSVKDAFVIQFSDERLGESLVQEHGFLGDIQLNWVFYERQLFQNTTAKVGKFPIPAGIYNEVLHVGTVHPFYRPPFGFYSDGSYTSETVDGAGLYQTFPLGSSWSLEADLFAGTSHMIQLGVDQNFNYTVFQTDANNMLGTQLWLYTPIDGLRIGASGLRSTNDKEPYPFPADLKMTHTDYRLSLDGRFDRFTLQAEYNRQKEGNYWTWWDYYVLGGVKLTRALSLNASAEWAKMDIHVGPQFDPLFAFDAKNIKMSTDYAVGLSYAFRPNLIAKAEYHQQKGYMQDAPVPNYFGDPLKAPYYIISLAVSF